MNDYLLDRCAVIRMAHNDPLRQSAAIHTYWRGAILFVYAITAWEIATRDAGILDYDARGHVRVVGC